MLLPAVVLVALVLAVLGLRAPGPTSVSEGPETEELSISPTLAASPAAVSPSWAFCLPLAAQEQLQAQLSNLGIGFARALEHRHTDGPSEPAATAPLDPPPPPYPPPAPTAASLRHQPGSGATPHRAERLRARQPCGSGLT